MQRPFGDQRARHIEIGFDLRTRAKAVAAS
jgi:hypothetical protein